MITVPKKPLILVLSCHGPLSLPTRTTLRKSFKGILNCCKLQIVFNNQLPNVLRFKNPIPKELTSGIVNRIQSGLFNESYYGECARHLNARIGEHIRISPLTKKKVKPKGSVVSSHLLLCAHSPYVESFSVLTKGNRTFVLDLTKNILIITLFKQKHQICNVILI